MSYTADDISEALQEYGELLVTLESDAYAEPVELHLHDTTIADEEITLELADGMIGFTPDRIESMAVHQQSTEDLGL